MTSGGPFKPDDPDVDRGVAELARVVAGNVTRSSHLAFVAEAPE